MCIRDRELLDFNDKQNSPISSIEKTLKSVIEYFIFDGTGQTKAMYPVNAILNIRDSTNIFTWNFINCPNKESRSGYIETVYPKLILSMRDKGMPSDSGKFEKCLPWIFETKGKSKGSLHIRISKN